MQSLSRRSAIQVFSILGLGACSKTKEHSALTQNDRSAWEHAKKLREQISAPKIPKQTFKLKDFGGRDDGKTDNTQAFKKAIKACAEAGGGRVLVDGAVFMSGPIHLESNINLHISKGSTIRFYTKVDRYLPEVFTRWEGVEHMGRSPLIYAFKKENIAITGEGRLDGQADEDHWWHWKGTKKFNKEGELTQKSSRDSLFMDAENGVPPEKRLYGKGHRLRPPFVQPYGCKNVLIENINVIRSPFWLLNPVLCENVIVRGVRLESLGPNSDGCNPESCKNVVIENCYFNTGDDCIAIKSGRNNDGRRVNVPSENIFIRNCQMLAGHGGVVIGSEISGGVRNVFAEDNIMSSPDLERGFRIKTNSVRGGVLENIYMRNCKIGQVQNAIVINFHYEEGDAGKFDPLVRNVEIDNLYCDQALTAFNIRGFKRAPIKNLRLRNINIAKAEKMGIIENVNKLKLEQVFINGKPFTL